MAGVGMTENWITFELPPSSKTYTATWLEYDFPDRKLIVDEKTGMVIYIILKTPESAVSHTADS